MKKLTAVLLCLCLLLCGCSGEASEAIESYASEVPVSEAAEVSIPEAEPEAVPAEASVQTPAQDDPAELGKWIWEESDAVEQGIYASDYDTEAAVDMTVGDVTTSQRISGRIREIDGPDGYIYHEEQVTDGVSAEVWFQDDMVYQASALGSFKAPVSKEDFVALNSANASVEMSDLGAGNFGKLIGEKTETGYKLTFGEADLDAWMAFSSMFQESLGDTQEMVTCTALTIDGVLETDQDLYATHVQMTIAMTLDMAGIPVDISMDMDLIYNGYNEEVNILVPAEDNSFTEISDINIPTLFIEGYTLMMSQTALHYEGSMHLKLSDDMTEEVQTQNDIIIYTSDDQGFRAQWDTTVLLDGEITSSSSDVYANGEGVLTDETGETPYTYDDAQFITDVSTFITYYVDSFDYGRNHVLSHEGDSAVLTYDLSSEYVEALMSEYISLEGLDIVDADGTMTVTFDGATGMVTGQDLVATLLLTDPASGLGLIVDLQDVGQLMACGADVVLP